VHIEPSVALNYWEGEVKICTGDRVEQPTYGVGDVIDVSGAYVTIAFDDGGIRKFVTARVQLQSSTIPRPSKPASTVRARRKRALSS
jgi:hypothetical protein